MYTVRRTTSAWKETSLNEYSVTVIPTDRDSSRTSHRRQASLDANDRETRFSKLRLPSNGLKPSRSLVSVEVPVSQRQKFLIDPHVQWPLTRRVMTHWLCLLVCLLLLSTLFGIVFSQPPTTIADAAREAFKTHTPMLIMMIAFVPLFLRDTVRLSNRFVGPMRRLRQVISDLASGGEGQYIEFRPGDHWQDAAEDFNRFYERYLELKERCEELERQLVEVKGDTTS